MLSINKMLQGASKFGLVNFCKRHKVWECMCGVSKFCNHHCYWQLFCLPPFPVKFFLSSQMPHHKFHHVSTLTPSMCHALFCQTPRFSFFRHSAVSKFIKSGTCSHRKWWFVRQGCWMGVLCKFLDGLVVRASVKINLVSIVYIHSIFKTGHLCTTI